ncbi:hypothetical protein CRYUN_Cryun08bG0050900 [Craigia yunnanensis]
MAPSLMFLILIDNLVLEDWQEGMSIAKDDQGNLVGQPRPTLIDLLELKIENCPNIQALPQIFAPRKLEIRRCGLITALPVPRFAQRLQHLVLETCSNGTLVRAIPSTNSLYSLVTSNISNLTSFPKLLHLPWLKILYIRLPTALECLGIGSRPILGSLGANETLKSLTSLNDLYVEDCPLIQSFPAEGLPSSIQHLQIIGCPLLIKQCQEEDAGTEWSKILDVPDLEIDLMDLPNEKMCIRLFICSKRILNRCILFLIFILAGCTSWLACGDRCARVVVDSYFGFAYGDQYV